MLPLCACIISNSGGYDRGDRDHEVRETEAVERCLTDLDRKQTRIHTLDEDRDTSGNSADSGKHSSVGECAANRDQKREQDIDAVGKQSDIKSRQRLCLKLSVLDAELVL